MSDNLFLRNFTEENSLVLDVKITDEITGFTIVGKKTANTNPYRHFHNHWEILYIVSGKRNFFYADKTYDIDSGAFLCVEPGVLHRAINEKSCQLYNIYFNCKDDKYFSLVLPILQKLNKKFGVLIQIAQKDRNEIVKNFFEIAKEFIEKKENYENVALAKLLQLLTLVSRSNEEKKILLEKSFAQKKCEEIMTYLSNNFFEQVTLNEVAENFGITPSYLSRFFKKTTQFSFIEYLNILRINHACKILKNTDKKIIDIAFESGFGSVTQFGRIFKSFTGTSPNIYRRK
ncbi:MAG: AraC family transcriptional regulator [Treponema sp.]|nr:AraC family transcriptional regulator [Treponema sp.]